MRTRKVVSLAVLGLGAIAIVVFLVGRASRIANRLLTDWAVATVAEESDSVYQLTLSRVQVNWARRRVRVDSIAVATHRGANARRPQSLPGLHLALHGCTISGVHIVTLARGGGLIADSFGCRTGSLLVEMPRSPGPAPAERAFVERKPFLVFQRGLRPPLYAPRVRIARVVFPHLAVDVRLPRTARGAIRLQLERLRWSMGELAIDPADTAAAFRPLFSRTIELAANTFITHSDRRTAIRVGLLRTSLTDSTLEVRGVGFAPNGSNAAFTRSRRYRSDLVRLSVGRITAQGIDFGALVAGEGVRARHIEVDSLRIDVTSDKRLAKRPSRPPRRTPQQWIAGLDETLSLDSLLVRHGEVVYREHVAGRAEDGVLTFARIAGAAANVRHFVGRRTTRDPMTLTARAHIQNVGQLDVRVAVPLDAPRFDMTLRGTLGAMPALALNPFVVETRALQIERGEVAGVAFSMAVKNGVAVGTITPRFSDLSVSVTRSGSEGILGGGGIVGGAARGIASFATKWRLRANNPDSPAQAPRVGTISHTFTPDETLIAFLWVSLRDGLFLVMKK